MPMGVKNTNLSTIFHLHAIRCCIFYGGGVIDAQLQLIVYVLIECDTLQYHSHHLSMARLVARAVFANGQVAVTRFCK